MYNFHENNDQLKALVLNQNGILNEHLLLTEWNIHGFKNQFVITDEVKNQIETTYEFFKLMAEECGQEIQPISPWCISYIEYGFSIWAGGFHRGANDVDWTADLLYAFEVDTYKLVREDLT